MLHSSHLTKVRTQLSFREQLRNAFKQWVILSGMQLWAQYEEDCFPSQQLVKETSNKQVLRQPGAFYIPGPVRAITPCNTCGIQEERVYRYIVPGRPYWTLVHVTSLVAEI